MNQTKQAEITPIEDPESHSPKQKMTTWQDNWKEILVIAWPLIVANSFWNLQLTIDRIFLGNYSTEALGAAMTVMGVFWTPMALLQQTAGYVTTFVAQYFGAKEFGRIGAALWQSIYVSVIGGLSFLLLIFASDSIFGMMGHSPNITKLESIYFKAITFSALPAAIVAAISGYFTGIGNTRIVIWINAAGLMTNVVFDYFLIFGYGPIPSLGIEGAGYATSIANWASAIVGVMLVLRDRYAINFGVFENWRFDPELFTRFLKFGLPSGFQWSLEALAFTTFLIIMGATTKGDAALASSSIAVTILLVAVLPVMGVAQAIMVLVGQYLGNGNPDRAGKMTWHGIHIAQIYISVMMFFFFIFPNFFVSWFAGEKSELWNQVKVMAPILVMIVGVFSWFDSLNMMTSFALKGAGDTKFVSLVALFIPWPLMVLPAWLLRSHENAVYLAWSWTIAFMVVQALIFTVRFRQGKWRTMSVIH